MTRKSFIDLRCWLIVGITVEAVIIASLSVFWTVKDTHGAELEATGTLIPVQGTFKNSRQSHSIVCIGDSLTLNTSHGLIPSEFWPAVLGNNLLRQGCSVQCRNFGHSGDTTTDMVNRGWCINAYGFPDVLIIFGGANDGTSTNLCQTNIQSMIQIAKFGVGDPTIALPSKTTVVANESNLPANCRPGMRMVVQTDTGSNGGCAAFGGYTPATITGTTGNNGVTTWECANPNAGTNGWRRIAIPTTTPTHCTKIMVMGMPYNNFTSGGDNGATSSTYIGIREAQQAAVTAEAGAGTWVIYCNQHSQFYALIVSGQETQGSNNDLIATNNQHRNVIGQGYFAQWATVTLNTQAAWIAALK